MPPKTSRGNAQDATTCHDYTKLQGTSQGRIFDLPPDKWIEEELVRVGARRPDGKAKAPSLKGEVHPLFARGNWPEIPDARYNALKQSMLFATKLISVSGAAFASFIPHFRTNTKRRVKACQVPIDDVEPTVSRLQRIKQAQEILRKAASRVKWYEDDQMLKSFGILGINAPSTMTPPFSIPQLEDWDDAIEEEGNDSYIPDKNGVIRSINIAVTSMMTDSIMKHEPGTESHLFATFAAGLNMTHELAHGLYISRSEQNAAEGEPYWGNAVEMELGRAYIAWLFGGFNIEPIHGDKIRNDPEALQHGFYWENVPQRGDTRMPFVTAYSVKVDFIERILSQDAWKDQPIATKPGLVRKNLLTPRELRNGKFQNGGTARKYQGKRNNWYEDRNSWAKGRDQIDFNAAPFQFVDLYWEEGDGVEHPDPRSESLPPNFRDLLERLDPKERNSYTVQYKDMVRNWQDPTFYELSDVSSQEEVSELDEDTIARTKREISKRTREGPAQPRPTDFVLSDGEEDETEWLGPAGGHGNAEDDDDDTAWLRDPVGPFRREQSLGASTGVTRGKRRAPEDEDDDDDDDEDDEINIPSFIKRPPKHKAEERNPSPKGKRSKPNPKSTTSTSAGPSKKNSSSSSSGVEIIGQRQKPAQQNAPPSKKSSSSSGIEFIGQKPVAKAKSSGPKPPPQKQDAPPSKKPSSSSSSGVEFVSQKPVAKPKSSGGVEFISERPVAKPRGKRALANPVVASSSAGTAGATGTKKEGGRAASPGKKAASPRKKAASPGKKEPGTTTRVTRSQTAKK